MGGPELLSHLETRRLRGSTVVSPPCLPRIGSWLGLNFKLWASWVALYFVVCEKYIGNIRPNLHFLHLQPWGSHWPIESHPESLSSLPESYWSHSFNPSGVRLQENSCVTSLFTCNHWLISCGSADVVLLVQHCLPIHPALLLPLFLSLLLLQIPLLLLLFLCCVGHLIMGSWVEKIIWNVYI